MAIQLKHVKATPLFRSVDLAYNSEEYVFAYHQSMADEAKAMVDYLYPYLLHLYDKKVLKKAFDPMHVKEMSSFKYDIVSDEVQDTIAESNYAMMKGDKLTGTQDFMEFDLSAMSLDKDESERPQASILGKMYSGQDSISTQHHAGRTRTPQPTTEEDIIEITQEELKELQHAMLLHTQTKGKLSERKNTLHISNMDTNTMLQQIRARKKEETQNTNDGIDSEDESSQIESIEQEVEMEDEEDNEQEEDGSQNENMEYHETEYSEEEDTDEYDRNNGSAGNDMNDQTNDEEYHDSNGMLATDDEQIGQSTDVGNEPPTPQREGGRG